MCGRPGTGKTILFSRVIENLRARNAKAIIHDLQGDYVSRFYDSKTDLIFNPFDKRCVGWNVFNEIENRMDVTAVAHSLIPTSFSQDQFWPNTARELFTAILICCQKNNKQTNGMIYNILKSENEMMYKLLAGTEGCELGAKHIAPDSKSTKDVISSMNQFTSCFEFMQDITGDFKIKNWLLNDKGGFLFMTNYSKTGDSTKPLLALLVDLMAREIQSLPGDLNRRIFFILDEFPGLQKIDSMVKLLVQARSKGASVWIATQDTGQIDKIYGREIKDSIVNACSTRTIFGLSDPNTAEYFSKVIGDREISKVSEGYVISPSDVRDGVNLNRKDEIQKLVLPSEIMGLQDLHFYCKLPNYPFTNSRLEIKHYNNNIESFIMREAFKL